MIDINLDDEAFELAMAHNAHIEKIADKIYDAYNAIASKGQWVRIPVLREEVSATAADFEEALTHITRHSHGVKRDRQNNKIRFNF